MTPRNSHRLGVLPSAHYASLFEEAAITINPAFEFRGEFHAAEAVAEIVSGELGFEIYFPVVDGAVPDSLIATARSALAQIVEMDDTARAIENIEDTDEYLSHIEIREDEVALAYVATTVNTEWDAVFTLDRTGTWTARRIGMFVCDPDTPPAASVS